MVRLHYWFLFEYILKVSARNTSWTNEQIIEVAPGDRLNISYGEKARNVNCHLWWLKHVVFVVILWFLQCCYLSLHAVCARRSKSKFSIRLKSSKNNQIIHSGYMAYRHWNIQASSCCAVSRSQQSASWLRQRHHHTNSLATGQFQDESLCQNRVRWWASEHTGVTTKCFSIVARLKLEESSSNCPSYSNIGLLGDVAQFRELKIGSDHPIYVQLISRPLLSHSFTSIHKKSHECLPQVPFTLQ